MNFLIKMSLNLQINDDIHNKLLSISNSIREIIRFYRSKVPKYLSVYNVCYTSWVPLRPCLALPLAEAGNVFDIDYRGLFGGLARKEPIAAAGPLSTRPVAMGPFGFIALRMPMAWIAAVVAGSSRSGQSGSGMLRCSRRGNRGEKNLRRFGIFLMQNRAQDRSILQIPAISKRQIDWKEVVRLAGANPMFDSVYITSQAASFVADIGSTHACPWVNGMLVGRYVCLRSVWLLAKRQTASAYLQTIASIGVLRASKQGREVYYINEGLLAELVKRSHGDHVDRSGKHVDSR